MWFFVNNENNGVINVVMDFIKTPRSYWWFPMLKVFHWIKK